GHQREELTTETPWTQRKRQQRFSLLCVSVVQMCLKKAAGGVLTAKQAPAGPAPPRRSVCAPVAMSPHCIADQSGKGERPMLFHSWLRNLRSALAPGRCHRRKPRRCATHRPRLEVLEDRTVPSGYQQINLVGNQPGVAHFTDPNLNGWGMTSLSDGSFCTANAFTTGLATFYDRSGHVLPQTITVPASASQPFGPVGHPSGVVYNPTADFVISEGGKSAPARLIFDSIDGTLSGCNPA